MPATSTTYAALFKGVMFHFPVAARSAASNQASDERLDKRRDTGRNAESS